ncbi:MAG: eukaryotic translation initiation factor 2-alpha kinase [Ramalina farinacea]|uniref:non-specific serine/threonine protein kinase n=1 Tax=Ramalina farinacea TaxID=258253 RepID=A0AA43TXN7_9LECA|nr:eukaryotic translation initiation factor 2-alpha kinase [Ramalina farinacea]
MAPSITNYSEIQNDEIEALRAIYPEDFHEEVAKVGAWNKALDKSFRIALRAYIADEEKIAVVLHVSFSPTYPKTAPKLSVNYDDDIRPATKTAIDGVIRDRPKTLLGSEMIYDLTVAVQDILDNASYPEGKDVPTLDEERVAREANIKAEAEKAAAQKQAEISKAADQEAAKEEDELLSKLVEQEKARAERRSANITDISEGNVEPVVIPNGLNFERSSTRIRTPNGKVVVVRAVSQKFPFQQSHGTTLFLVQSWKESNVVLDKPFLCLKEATFEGDGMLRKQRLQDLESRLEYQMNASPHAAVVKPLNYRIQRTPAASGDSPQWLVSILTEFTAKGSLQDLMSVSEALDVRRLKFWSIQLLEGLHHYHQQGLAHGSVHLGNILLWESEAATVIVKWSDGIYGYDLRMIMNQMQTKTPLGWTPPETLASEDSRHRSTRTDIWMFGVCLLQMAFGENVSQQYDTPAAAIGEVGLSQSMRSLLKAMFELNLKKRPSAWDLLHFEFFRNDEPYCVDIPQSLSLTKYRTRRESEAANVPSEYARKFVEEGRLGRGGFGEVFRARNRTDGQLYAIKKIKARSRAALDPVLSEVTVLSRLNHPNVVRYFASWIEEDEKGTLEDKSSLDISQETMIASMSSLGLHAPIPLSSRGLDFISSSHVVFGDNEEFDDESDSENEDNASSSGSSLSPEDQLTNGQSYEGPSPSISEGSVSEQTVEMGPPHSPWTNLYIQMEYCKQETLRNLINSGIQSNQAQCWRLFGQIVRGLEHIHAASIVHRDLKPENIFIDDGGDIRIGDFGLARPGEGRSLEMPRSQSNAVGSFTRDVGTAWYIAPEVRSGGAGQYDEKADMFSLGVILVEMNVLFTTGMERAEALKHLAEEDHKLPPAFSNPDRSTQAAIATSLLQYQSNKRPSCSELVREIPVQDEDQTSRLLRKEMANPESKLRLEFIENLFARQGKDKVAGMTMAARPMSEKVSLLDAVNAMARNLPDMELQAKVKSKLTKIFRRHGAVERTDNPALFPQHPCYAAADTVRVLDATGKLLQLPYDLVLPNAILLAQSSRGDYKTFTFGDVFRPDPRLQDPNIFGESDFDIIGSATSNLALDEAETMKVIDEVIDGFPNLSSTSMCYHINHSQVLDKIFMACNISREKWFGAKEVMSKLNTGEWTWSKIRPELRAPPLSLASTSLDELEQFDFREPLERALPKLRLLLRDTTDLEATFAHLNNFMAYVTRMNVRRKVFMSPLATYNEKFYSGHLFFQCLHDRKRKAVFAAGGRYDKLIRDHQVLAARSSITHAVGFQMTWSGLCTGMMSYLEAQTRSKAKKRSNFDRLAWTSRRCDVLIDCYDAQLLDTVGIRILSELWANDISAELANKRNPGFASNAFTKSAPIKENYSWVILIKSPDTLKVKAAFRPDEAEVWTADLAQHIRSEIRERNRNEGRHAAAPLLRHESQPEKSSMDSEPDVKVLVSLNKSKKFNRKAVVEDAIAQAQEWRRNSVENKIIAVETKDEVFQALHRTNLSDPDSWKRLIQNVPVIERAYLTDLHSLLKELQDSSAVFIYNFRTKGILYYQLTKEALYKS